MNPQSTIAPAQDACGICLGLSDVIDADHAGNVRGLLCRPCSEAVILLKGDYRLFALGCCYLASHRIAEAKSAGDVEANGLNYVEPQLSGEGDPLP
jgi:hypothetical protein